MTKRKRNTIDEESIDRARQEVSTEKPKNEPAPAVRSTKSVSERRADQRRSGSGSVRKAQSAPIQYSQAKKKDVMTNERIEQLLANPTKIVTEEELRREYGHVLNDLRNMFGLALVLMIVLVILAQII